MRGVEGRGQERRGQERRGEESRVEERRGDTNRPQRRFSLNIIKRIVPVVDYDWLSCV